MADPSQSFMVGIKTLVAEWDLSQSRDCLTGIYSGDKCGIGWVPAYGKTKRKGKREILPGGEIRKERDL